jgi:hypothetical protein
MEREIEVEGAEDAPRRPVAFKVGGQRYVVAAVLSTWEDEEPGGRTRRQRRHRTFYRLRTEEGHLFDIYFDWAEARRRHRDRWVLHRRLAAAAEPSPMPEPEAETPPTEGAGGDA